MRPAYGIVLAIVVAIGMGIAYYGLWMGEHREEYASRRTQGFPVVSGVTSVVVLDEAGEIVRTIDGEVGIAELLKRLGQAPRSYFGDPEQSGRMYRVELHGGGGTSVYELNDLRGSGSSIDGKIYPQNPGRDEVWELSGDLLARLVDRAAPASAA
ncbi:hypothetical protein [Cohnella nanjingensis]|uniref:Uncharacterized protein n=1 Tax=Cohnella nanjingensis TaxID=1387779 RepID=A0A7X0VGL6_9BACL|nr:hypothetical protein [Cohnella nanjingensis]MBB6671784.1 hypothetical protein [Cohnella nanjingensis]